MEFSRQEYWSGLPFTSAEDLPNPGIKSGSPALQADSLLSELLQLTKCLPPSHLRQLQPGGCLCVLSARYSPSSCPKYIIDSPALKITHHFPFY